MLSRRFSLAPCARSGASALFVSARGVSGVAGSVAPSSQKIPEPPVRPNEKKVANVYASLLSDGLGNGSVIPLSYDYHRPVYMVPSFSKMMVVIFFWFQQNIWPNIILSSIVLFGLHGGFSGHVPPDPHDLHH